MAPTCKRAPRVHFGAPSAKKAKPHPSNDSLEDWFEEEVLEETYLRRSGNRIYFYADVTIPHALEFQVMLDEMVRENRVRAAERDGATPDPIWVYIHSYGGDAYAGLSMLDAIRTCACDVYTVVDGFCASAATLMLLGARKRYMRKHANVLIHQIRTEFGGKFEDLLDETHNTTRLMQAFKDIYTKDTKLTRTKIETIIRKEMCLDANECLQYGIVHHLL